MLNLNFLFREPKTTMSPEHVLLTMMKVTGKKEFGFQNMLWD